MNLTLAYRGRSGFTEVPSGLDVTLEPNLSRDRVAYDGMLKHPVRFREAIGALHDVVVSDLRYKPHNKSAYEAYKVEQNRREAGIRRVVAAQTEAATLKLTIRPSGRLRCGSRKATRQAPQKLLVGKAKVLELPDPARSGSLAAADALRSGHHRRTDACSSNVQRR